MDLRDTCSWLRGTAILISYISSLVCVTERSSVLGLALWKISLECSCHSGVTSTGSVIEMDIVFSKRERLIRFTTTQSSEYTSQRLDMCSGSYMADVETMIQLVPDFLSSVPSEVAMAVVIRCFNFGRD
jgi:hypothetical protein